MSPTVTPDFKAAPWRIETSEAAQEQDTIRDYGYLQSPEGGGPVIDTFLDPIAESGAVELSSNPGGPVEEARLRTLHELRKSRADAKARMLTQGAGEPLKNVKFDSNNQWGRLFLHGPLAKLGIQPLKGNTRP
jgi:hypothetical protein